jgi:hypothetical protein
MGTTSQEREVTVNLTCLFIMKDALFYKLQFIDFPDILIGGFMQKSPMT